MEGFASDGYGERGTKLGSILMPKLDEFVFYMMLNASFSVLLKPLKSFRASRAFLPCTIMSYCSNALSGCERISIIDGLGDGLKPIGMKLPGLKSSYFLAVLFCFFSVLNLGDS